MIERADGPPLERADLIQVLAAGDLEKIRRTLTRVKAQRDKSALLPLVEDLWAGRRAADAALPWPMIDRPKVRVELGHILALAAAEGAWRGDLRAINAYVLDQADAEDPATAMTAILTLGVIDDPQSVAPLAEFARGGWDGPFLAAVIGLSMMCQAEARAALDQISADLTDPTQKDFLQRVRAGYSGYTRARCP
ncbi:MAG: hypothetical protein AAF495_04850 [Pseudomonadota bacterium]